MSETRVIHFRDWDRSDPNSVYIGRAVPRRKVEESRWGNPFKIYANGMREAAIRLHREWVTTSDEPRAVWVREHVHELRGKTLVCWCAPNACHGDVLAEMADGTKETVSA